MVTDMMNELNKLKEQARIRDDEFESLKLEHQTREQERIRRDHERDKELHAMRSHLQKLNLLNDVLGELTFDCLFFL
jgi:replicative DNA helicase